MRAMRTFLVLSTLVGALLAACSASVGTTPSTPPSTDPPAAGDPAEPPSDTGSEAGEESAGDEQTARAPGDDCTDGTQCSSGICEGEGCGDDTPGKCIAADRMCTRDARSYCGCDGKTFVGSGTCPGQRFASAGACEGDPGPLGKAP